MGYANIQIPKELADEIDDLVKSKYRGYTSRAEFVKEACREKLDKLKENYSKRLIR